jgi:hypothetical protein
MADFIDSIEVEPERSKSQTGEIGGETMQTQRAAHAFGLALLLALSTVAAPASAQDAVQDPKQPSVDNPHMHIWGSSDLNNCWTHFDANDSSGSSNDGYGEKEFSEGQQVDIDLICKMQDNLKQDMYLNPNGTIRFDFIVNIDSMDCSDNSECKNLTVTLSKGSMEVGQNVWPVDSVNSGNDVTLSWDLPTNETMERWNKSIDEPQIRFEYSAPGWTTLDCILFDCPGYFRLYFSNNENNDTVEINFPVVNQTIPGEGGGDGDGIGGAVSDALPGFGLVAGIGALALAAVGASRFTREE